MPRLKNESESEYEGRAVRNWLVENTKDEIIITDFIDDVKKDLTELNSLGVFVPSYVYVLLRDIPQMMDYAMNMKVSDCADLLIQLANIKVSRQDIFGNRRIK